jgi:hypothetical protein
VFANQAFAAWRGRVGAVPALSGTARR